MVISGVQIEQSRAAFGIGTATPRLSWMVETEKQNWMQAEYEIELFDSDGKLTNRTGRVTSSQSVLVDWPFSPLESRDRVYFKVRAWGEDGEPTAWSELTPIEIGLLHFQDWQAHFITPGWTEDTSKGQPAPYFRREMTLRSGIEKARLYISALGVYEANLNGSVIGDQVMAPGWTSYHHHLRYQTFDVTQMLTEGLNAIGVIVGDGWYRGRLGGRGGRRNIYGDRLGLIAQLEIEYQDGTHETINSDETWRVATGPILFNDIYDGETYDARLEFKNWFCADFQDGDWKNVNLLEWDLTRLVAPLGPPVRRMELVAPKAIITSPSGRTLLDFGQNLVGRLRISVKGSAGQTITMRHAEVLESGELCTRPLRIAEATDRYTLRGGGIETWEPRFTFHGFRYAEIDNWPGEMNLGDIQAVVCHSDLERTGWFECSEPLLNQLHQNVLWSMRGNFLDIPTDCPQRDERLGWTGDLQVFSPAASYLYNVSGFLDSWLRDLAVEQFEAGGIVPFVVPYILNELVRAAAAWGDAAVVVPWVLYQHYGDKDILATQFKSMRTWVDWIAGVAGESLLWDKGFQFGDWLDPAAPPDKPGEARTDKGLLATAYFAHSAEWVGRAAGVLGLAEEEIRYLTLAGEIRRAFAREYITPSGRLLSDTQTAYALAIAFELFPQPAQRQHAAERLEALVIANDYHIGTGFVGTPLICDALSSTGHLATAYHLLLERSCPSWLYPITMGATTIWERWDSMLPDGSVNPGKMTSFNHYALGAVADWMHRTIGGLNPLEPGYQRFEIRPRPGGSLTQACAKLSTPYGLAQCEWVIEDGEIEVKAIIPPNTTACVILPGREDGVIEVGSGKYQWKVDYLG